MLIIPETYLVEQLHLHLFKLTYNKGTKVYNSCCPFCREGKHWGVKKRLYYILKDRYAYCHNCGYSGKDIKFLTDLTGKTFFEIKKEIEQYDNTIDLDISKFKQEETPQLNLPSLPTDCINLFDNQQVKYYNDNKVVKAAVELVVNRRLNTAINKPHALYLSLTDKYHRNRLIIPFYNEKGDIIFYQSRAIFNTKDKNYVKYKSKAGAIRSLYGIHSIDYNIQNVFIFEGPIDSFFVKNGVAMCGITEKGGLFNHLQKEQLSKLFLLEEIYILDNQWLDRASFYKTEYLLNENKKVFIWPRNQKLKDFNDICIKAKRDEISPSFIYKHTYNGLKGELLLKQIKSNYT